MRDGNEASILDMVTRTPAHRMEMIGKRISNLSWKRVVVKLEVFSSYHQ